MEECYIIGEVYRSKLYVSELRVAHTLQQVRECLDDQRTRCLYPRCSDLTEYIERSNMRVYRITPGAGNEPVLIRRKELIEMLASSWASAGVEPT